MYHYACITHPLEGRGMVSSKYIGKKFSAPCQLMLLPPGDLPFPLCLPELISYDSIFMIDQNT